VKHQAGHCCRFCIASFLYVQQGSKNQRQRESARKPEGVVAESERPNTQAEGRDRNLDKTASGGNKDEREADTAEGNAVQPQQPGPKDNSSRRPRDSKDSGDKVRVNVSSREFVRGGRGRLRGSARGRGRGGQQDVYASGSRRDLESVSQCGSAEDDSSARVASATSTKTRSNGTEHPRPGDSRTDAQQSKNGDRKSSLEASTGFTKMSTKDRENGRGTVQLPADDKGGETRGASSAQNTSAKDTGRWSERSAPTSRRRTEFYDSRNRGQKIRQTDAGPSDANKPQQQQPKCSNAAKVSSRSTAAKDGADVEKRATESSQNVADASTDKCSNEVVGEQTSQRKSGGKSSLAVVYISTAFRDGN